jgi:C4-type Zn-finger protein
VAGDGDEAVKCPSCRTKVVDPVWTSALVPAVPHMRFKMWRCPSCGYEEYDVEDER